jgi:hypothetical protein
MIDSMIFSKDRACQLDLLLRSIKDNFKELKKIIILYLPTDNEFEKGYEIVKKTYPDFEWIKESNFVKDTLDIFNSFKNEFLVNFVDDEIVIRKNSIKEALDFLRNQYFHCISLRMAPHINYCYTGNLSDEPPEFENVNNLYMWDWRKAKTVNGDWNYPSCINSHIYKTEDFKKYISMIQFQHPNGLEANFNNIRQNFKPFNICFKKSKSVNIANNLIQNGTNQHGLIPEWQVNNLNNQFLNGRRLSTKPFYNFENTFATFEKDYEWEN